MEARKDGILPGVEENKALLSAVVSYMAYERGLTTQVSFVFNPKLESVGKWWCQLLAESLGKDGKGVTPLISVGTNDLHSMLQLYIDGPRDKFFNFISCESEMSREVRAVLSGVKKSFDEHKIPYTETILDRIDEHSLGYFMQTKMMEVIMLGKLMGINPFGQSAVEDYKKYARELLA
ncbi:MAG: Glucose-6-phosphate isomerase [candidate division WWE3 bacterium GW2011_GWC1_41_7]|nr:MAG: Glucose-6-phosphate isomerase [candidate division WWE3 bacterium GW2011_GWC1_41_7]